MTKRLGKLQQGRFGIGFVGSTLYGPLPGLVRRFRTIHPELIVELLELTTLQQVDALKDGRIDVGFGRLYLEVPTVKQETLREEPLVVAIPIGHPLLDRNVPRSRRAKGDLADYHGLSLARFFSRDNCDIRFDS